MRQQPSSCGLGKDLRCAWKRSYATSLEAEYPRRFCVSLVRCVIRQLQQQNMGLPPDSLFDLRDSESFEMQSARIASQQQSRRGNLPPLIPEHNRAVVCIAETASCVYLSLSCPSCVAQFNFTTSQVNNRPFLNTPSICDALPQPHLFR